MTAQPGNAPAANPTAYRSGRFVAVMGTFVLREYLRNCPSYSALAQAYRAFMQDYLRGAREAVLDADLWADFSPHAGPWHLADNLAEAASANCLGFGIPDPHAVDAAALLLEVTEPRQGESEEQRAWRCALRARFLARMDRHLIRGRFKPDVAEVIGFGDRRVDEPSRADYIGTWWTHAAQVAVALESYVYSDWTLDQAVAVCARDEALTAVLDRLPAPPEPWLPAALPGLLTNALVQGPDGTDGTLDILRVLRDHPKTASAFWPTILALRNPTEHLLNAIEPVAGESGGPGARDALSALSGEGDVEWRVPDEIAKRVRTRLRAAAMMGEELIQP